MIELREVALFRGLEDSEIEKVKGLFSERACQAGEILFAEKEPCRNFFIVRQGSVKLFWASSHGHREQILETLNAGDTCLCHPAAEMCCNVTAQAGRRTVIWQTTVENFRRVLQEYPAVSAAATLIFSEKLRTYSNLVRGLAVKSSQERVIAHLMALAEKKGFAGPDGVVIEFSGTRQDMASQIGTSRENFQRCLSMLRKSGFILVRRRQIIIRKQEQLKQCLTDSAN